MRVGTRTPGYEYPLGLARGTRTGGVALAPGFGTRGDLRRDDLGFTYRLVVVGVATGVLLPIDAVLGQLQQSDDCCDRAEDEQDLVPTTLVRQQHDHVASMTTSTSSVMWLSTS